MFYVLLIIGFLLRVILIPSPGFKADIGFWKAWGLAVVDKGPVWLMTSSNYNYPPGFAYILYVVNKIYNLFANPYKIEEYWRDNNLLYLSLFKVIPIVSDILVVWLLLAIGRKLGSPLGKILAIFYFLSPAVLFDGALWGQVDQFGLMLFLAVFYLMLIDRYRLAGVIFALSFLMKFQNIIFIPLFYLYVWKRNSFRAFVECLWSSFATSLVVILPFLIVKQSAAIIRLVTINADWFPWYSLNAFNGWWLASGLKGMQVTDRVMVFGVTTAKQLGLILFVGVYFIAFVSVLLEKREHLNRTFIVMTSLVVFGFFHLLTASHERYAFHLMGLLLVAAMFAPTRQVKPLFIFIMAFAIFFFLNLYLAMYFNYPDVVIWPFAAVWAKYLSGLVAVAQIGLFLFFCFRYIGPYVRQHWRLVGGFGLVLMIGLLAINANYILRRPIALTAIKPIGVAQDYLSLQVNRTVNSDQGPFHWSRLSDNYYFYDQGFGSHADSRIEYRLGGRFARFVSDIGLDTEGDVNAAVTFAVEGDGKELYQSKPKGRFDTPTHVSVGIKGVDSLVLWIRRVGKSNFGAHADWFEPKVVR